jgi:hypothetical protein
VVGLGGKGPVTGHREGAPEPEEKTPVGWGIWGNQEAALLRKALNQKKEETAGGAEAKEETSQALPAVRLRDKAGKRLRDAPSGAHIGFGNTGNEVSNRTGHPQGGMHWENRISVSKSAKRNWQGEKRTRRKGSASSKKIL